jgi:ribosomal protein L4
MRAGSRRSPLWVGGGYFRTKTHRISKRVNKRRLAILSALYLKKKNLFSLTKMH